MSPTHLDQAIKTMRKEEVDAFLSKNIHTQKKTMFLGNNMHMMMQTFEEKDVSCLPHGLSVMNTYTEMTIGSK